MGEFKDGTLKSGGSGKKVTNPKQAIAIALSEAEGMNQGGMMYNQIDATTNVSDASTAPRYGHHGRRCACAWVFKWR